MKLNYSDLLKNYSWIIKNSQNAIISPDSDGLLCGLFMSNILRWKICGYYDGKILILKEGLKPSDCIFLDMEIYRTYIRSIGHHMVLFNNNKKPDNWSNFNNCIQPNNIRGFDGYKNFSQKYPFATIHLLLSIISHTKTLSIPQKAICPLLYTDGVFKNLFNYPENCLSWISYLDDNNKNNPFYQIIFNNYTLSNFMLELKNFFIELNKIGKGADKIKISDSKGNIKNLEKTDKYYSIDIAEKNKSEKFLNLLSSLTDWEYNNNNWTWANLNLFKFTKNIIKPSNNNYDRIMQQNPLSFAMTSTLSIEYTIESPDKIGE